MKYDFEQMRDEIEKEFSIAAVNEEIKNNPEIAASFTKRDRGIKASIDIYQSWDGQTNQDDINRAIHKISKSTNKYSNKENIVRSIVTKLMSDGYYGYMLLRKAIGHKLEHPVLRPWYANRLPQIPSLINPGGEITLTEGEFVLSGQITLDKDNIWLHGKGISTIISGVGTNGNGYIRIDAHLEARNNIKVSDMYIDATGWSTQSNYAPVIGNATSGAYTSKNIELNNIKIRASNEHVCPIYFGEGDNPQLENVRIRNCDVRSTGTKIYGIGFRCKTTNLWIEGNKVDFPNAVANEQYNPIAVYWLSEYVHINANRILNTGGHSSIGISPAHYVEIIGNIVKATERSEYIECGIEVEEGLAHQPDTTGTSHHIIISGNYIYGGAKGIATRADSSYPAIYGIVAANNIIEYCTLGVWINTRVKQMTVVDNIITNCTTEITNDSTENTNRIIDNEGYNPVGNFTAPSMPNSGVNYTNDYGYPCMVQVYGGNVTDIDIDDVATGLTSGTFIIPPSGTINITYSSAPSWRWWGL